MLLFFPLLSWVARFNQSHPQQRCMRKIKGTDEARTAHSAWRTAFLIPFYARHFMLCALSHALCAIIFYFKFYFAMDSLNRFLIDHYKRSP